MDTAGCGTEWQSQPRRRHAPVCDTDTRLFADMLTWSRRYLRARKFDVKGAYGQFTDTEKWLKEQKVEELYEHFDVELYERARLMVSVTVTLRACADPSSTPNGPATETAAVFRSTST